LLKKDTELKAKDDEITALKNKLAFLEQENKHQKEMIEFAKMRFK
jgi:hypothetical protein